MRFAGHMVPEVHQTFWEAMARGAFITEATRRRRHVLVLEPQPAPLTSRIR